MLLHQAARSSRYFDWPGELPLLGIPTPSGKIHSHITIIAQYLHVILILSSILVKILHNFTKTGKVSLFIRFPKGACTLGWVRASLMFANKVCATIKESV